MYGMRNPDRLGAGATIPPITDPMGRSWRQPSTEKITLTEKTATMDRATFEALCEYTTTVPSGVYPGKMWRAQAHNGLKYGRIQLVVPETWLLRWYGPHPEPGLCSVNQREIVIK